MSGVSAPAGPVIDSAASAAAAAAAAAAAGAASPSPTGASAATPEASSSPAPPSSSSPGVFDALHNESRGVLPAGGMAFEGARFSLMRMIGESLQVGHTFNMNKQEGSSYHFAPTFLGPYRRRGPEGFPIVMGDIDGSGNLMLQGIHEVSDALKLKLQAQARGSAWQGCQLEAEYGGRDWVATAKAVNANPLEGSIVGVANYLQNLTESIAVGGEFTYQLGGGQEVSVITYGARYRTAEVAASLTVAPSQAVVNASYYQKLNKKSIVAADFEIDGRQGDTSANLGYHYVFNEASFRGQISSKGVVTAMLEKPLNPSMALLLSGQIDHWNGDSKFGIGFMVQL